MSKDQFKKNRTKGKLNYEHHVVVISRSNKNIIAQVLEPITKKTLVTVDSTKINKGTKTEKSTEVGKKVADFLKSKKVDRVVFDRNGLIFTGRVKALAAGITNNNITI
jgi:large subunit ribosomal protein L18